MAVEAEYVLLADVAAGITIRIPMYLVDAVIPNVQASPPAAPRAVAPAEPPAVPATPPGEAA